MAQLTSDMIHETLGPDVTLDCYKGTIMPYDAVHERRIVDADTRDWWIKAHRQATKPVRDYKIFGREIAYHDRFRGYCPRCQGA